MADEKEGKESENENPPTIDPASSSKPESQDSSLTLGQRVQAIEKRWGKSFEEVLIDIHDHLFGKSV